MHRSITRRLAIGVTLLAACILFAALCLGTAAVAGLIGPRVEAVERAPVWQSALEPRDPSVRRLVAALRWAGLSLVLLGLPAAIYLAVQARAVRRGLRAVAGRGDGVDGDELAAVASIAERLRRSEATLAHVAATASMLGGEARRSGEGAERIDALMRRGARLAEEASRAAAGASAALHDTGEAGAVGLAAAEESVRAVADALERLGRGLEGTRALEKGTTRIEEIVALIADVADQTELLSLNAAIEAARADEAGRGFSVVALEVRKLADRSAKAASEISELIAAVLEAVRGIAAAARDTHASLADIRKDIERTETLVRGTVQGIASTAAAAEKLGGSFESLRGIAVEGVHLAADVADAGRMTVAGINDMSRRLAAGGEGAGGTSASVAATAAETMVEAETVEEAELVSEGASRGATEVISEAETVSEVEAVPEAEDVSEVEAVPEADKPAAAMAREKAAEEPIEELESVEDEPTG